MNMPELSLSLSAALSTLAILPVFGLLKGVSPAISPELLKVLAC